MAAIGSFLLSLLATLPSVNTLVQWGLPVGWIVLAFGLGVVMVFTLERLEGRKRVDRAGTHPVSLTPGQGRPVPLWGKFGKAEVDLSGLVPTPASAVPTSRRFLLVLSATFLGLSAVFLLLFTTVIDVYDQMVGVLATFLYWPLSSPLVEPHGRLAPIAPDYIFPMYLSAMVAYSVATGLWFNRPARAPQRRAFAVLVVLSYVLFAMIVDVLFQTTPYALVLDFAPVVRIFTGGLFLAMLILSAVHLPKPQSIEARFPREPREILVFLGLGTAALFLALAVLFFIRDIIPPKDFLYGVTVLLVLPFLTLTFFILLGHVRYSRMLKRSPLPPLSAYHPPVSIVVPAFNEEQWIEWTLWTADQAAAKYPGTTQIIVAVDGSTDRTLSIARRTIARLEHSKGMVLDLPHGGKSSALNSALAMATGEIVIRCDGDTFICPNKGFAEMIPHFADPKVGGVQGAIHPRQREGWTRKVRAMEIAWNHYFLRPAGMGTRSAEVIDGLFSAFRRKDLVDIGGWVPWNGEDSEISMRIQRLGYQTRIEDRALAYEDVPENYASLRRQRIRWGRGILMANGQHYPALLGRTPEFGGLGVLFWFLFFLRASVRGLVVVYLLLLLLLVGVPALFGMAVLVGLALGIRSGPVAYYLVRMGRMDVLPWLLFYPIAGFVKQSFQLEALGTLGPTAAAEYAF